MFDAYRAKSSSWRLTAGVKTAVLVLVLGVVALIADVSLTSPRALLLEDARGVPAEVAAIDLRMVSTTAHAARPVRTERPTAREVAADPSVPPASSLPLAGDDVRTPTF